MSILGAFMVPHPPMIIKEIGGGREKDIQKTIDSYQDISRKINELNPDTIIISSPHTEFYRDHFFIANQETITGSFENFLHPEISFDEVIDQELTNEIIRLGINNNLKMISNNEDIILDHGTMIPLHFIEELKKDFKIVVLGISNLPFIEHYKLGKVIKEAINNLNRKAVYIASGDLSHKLQEYGPYGFAEEGPIYDQEIMEIMGRGDFYKLLTFDKNLCDKASECGHRSFIIMAGALDKTSLEIKEYSHEDITGVGYGICSYIPTGIDESRNYQEIYEEEHPDIYVELARRTINEYIKNNKEIKIDENIPKELLNKQSGVFVSIHEFNDLRGCIGTISPTEDTIAEEIIRNAIAAATKDPRFDPIREEELEYLEINVDELGPKEIVNSVEELDEKKYGVIVSCDFRRGLLLPNLDNVNSVEEQISIALKKGNISKDEDYTIERFEVIRHK